ncbi:hypothetical protein FBU59_003944, partial [Linderina macrospora]
MVDVNSQASLSVGDADTEIGDADYPIDYRFAWREAHPEYPDSEHYFDGTDPDDQSVYHGSMWSDTYSEISDTDAHQLVAGSIAARRPSVASLFKPGHRLQKVSNSERLTRPVSQLSFNRTTQSPTPVENAHFGAYIGPAASSFGTRRARGLTISSAVPWHSHAVTNLPLSTLATPTRIQFPDLPPAAAAAAVPENPRERQFVERRLARLIIDRWRRHKLVQVGETMLRNAIHLKEANVISKELGQRVVYQFAVLRGGADSFPVSPLEPDALPAILSEWDTITMNDAAGPASSARQSKSLGAPSSMGTVPEVVVKVLDIVNKSWYVWSLDRFLEQLEKMQRLSTVKGSYRAHL